MCPSSKASISGFTPQPYHAQVIGGVEREIRAEVHRPAVEAADFRAQLFDVEHALLRPRVVGSRRCHRGVGFTRDVIAAHSRRQVDDHIGVAVANALHDLSKERSIAIASSSRDIAHVNVGDRGPRLGGFDRGIGDLLWGYRDRGVHADRVTRAGYRTGDDHFVVHGDPLGSIARSEADRSLGAPFSGSGAPDEHHSDG
jgi:hypothetical protein